MSYLREVKKEELAAWLESISYEQRDSTDLAEALLDKWDVLGLFNNL